MRQEINFFFVIFSKAKDERNYHIFYTMLAGLSGDEKNTLALTDAREYEYLKKVSSSLDIILLYSY